MKISFKKIECFDESNFWDEITKKDVYSNVTRGMNSKFYHPLLLFIRTQLGQKLNTGHYYRISPASYLSVSQFPKFGISHLMSLKKEHYTLYIQQIYL